MQQKTAKIQDIIVEEQVRKDLDPGRMAELTASVKTYGILQPLLVTPAGRLLAGHRRLLAAKAAGLETAPVIVTDRLLSDSEIRLIQLTENMQREDLSGHEKWLACSELMTMNPQWSLKNLAECMHIDASMVTRILSPSKCVAAWREALRLGKVSISDCYAASKLDENDQAGLLELKLSGASRDRLEEAGRQKRVAAPAVRISRVKCLLPSGVQVVVSGDGVSLDESIDALNEAVREMRRARELGFTAKTFSAAMKDKAAKG
ncbi:ParB/RepB/Spo0J family partition protein [Zavarzinella formosa]|uniref:ParB/RepB/Spo0J family partition protein n=1 Tax=Zavarzinella formosa TaxID=360055 RepID=UPI0002DFFE63|nr:ParB/RepB/Spo0J family partition protein [Zavarzinella formosa]